jgi:hypothetical protein
MGTLSSIWVGLRSIGFSLILIQATIGTVRAQEILDLTPRKVEYAAQISVVSNVSNIDVLQSETNKMLALCDFVQHLVNVSLESQRVILRNLGR